MSPCKSAFENVEIHLNGDVFTCCPSWVSMFSLGNVFQENFENIINSQKAIEFRKKILNDDYSLCDRKRCINFEFCDKSKFSETVEYPKFVKFCYDKECNYRCITCRDSSFTNSEAELNFYDSKIYDVFLPILKNAEIVSLSGSGDPLVSVHSRNLIKAIIQEYPNIKFELHTNGSRFNHAIICDNLGILNQLSRVLISVHAATEETYKQITKRGNFTNVLKNIEWASELKKQRKIDKVSIIFVVHQLNYKEMPDFAKLAEKLGIESIFWGVTDWGTSFTSQYKEIAVFEKNHPEFYKLKEIISNNIFQNPSCTLSPQLKEIIET